MTNDRPVRDRLADPTLFREAALIGGTWIESEKRIPVTNPATSAVIGHIPALGQADTTHAINAAAAAMPAWAALSAAERGATLRQLFDLMRANREDLAIIMTAEQGKPLTEARGEIDYAASFIAWFAEEATRVGGDIIPSPTPGRRILVMRQPVGVFGAITPWNFPAAMITRKAGPGWAAGCAAVIRPASQTPFSALALGVLAERAGLPPGLCNIITGDPEPIAAELTGNPLVRKLSFTGSTAIGARLLAQCAPGVKKTSMELGGNAPFVVFDDADLDAAVEGAMAAKFRNTGQACTAANRFIVQAGIHDRFVAAMATRLDGLVVGDGFTDKVTIGPLIEPRALEKVDALVQDAITRGARLVRGGGLHPLGGNFYAPTLLADVPVDARVFGEEIFGPVAPVFRFEHEAEAIALANATEYGLAAYLYTTDLGRAFRVAEAIEAGMVGVNEGIISTAVAPFGGVKASGLGREGSRQGIEEYLEMKYVALGGLGVQG
ncbi:NAD-dependent succinate-semialdehyde dehydrogenase [Sphingomonas sp. AR_OL41]|uniref:NAD-dependent succinate-semialdehyde dehydrogenase n=1 Tax=Sphingomonas sp. AR_OL41 TaxID=3042729 RepID=UPI00247FD8C7|nr:NAD-dependent succinate-semialdehyde dehydrogenase [Sphingomonas sp. AR_OL41]MDH7973260.1 NAD-dependent succinate-semialdehyde dehydrogenase [Sphingomonas sp. AR_OL41]